MSHHRVLIPLDGSGFRQKIFPEVQRFLDPKDTELFLLHVIDKHRNLVGVTPMLSPEFPMPTYVQTSEKSPEELQAEVETELKEKGKQFEELGYSIKTMVCFGDLGEEILKVVEIEDINMVAMTTYAREGVRRLIFGSVAGYILHNTSIPVLLMRPEADGKEALKPDQAVDKAAA